MPLRLVRFFVLAACLAGAMSLFPAAAEETAGAAVDAGRADDPPERITTDVVWDLYYTSADMIISLTDTPIPQTEEQSEFEIYRDLLKTSYLPRFVLLEASVNPMPCAGVFIKKNARELYDESQVNDDLNLVKIVSAGFDEPYALSVFFGNVISFRKKEEQGKDWNNGYMGYLFSCGDYHIKDNEFIYDKWFELEWKLKGDLVYNDQKLGWSFRTGAKHHDHPEIADSVYISMRRSRVDFDAPSASIWKNSGFEYTFNVAARTFKPISHYFSVDKKWPVKNRRFAFALAVGFIWEANRKYTGSLAREGGSDFQFLVRPNIIF